MNPPKCRDLLGGLVATLALLSFSLPTRTEAAAPPAKANTIEARVANLEKQTDALRKDVKQAAGPSVLALFLSAAFCALWAQNTNRNAWLWFFLGFFFAFITVFVLLWKNAKDRKRRAAPVEEAADLQEPVCI